MNSLDQTFEDALWICRSLFERGKTSGSSANISFRIGDAVYISGSGTSFGRLGREDFGVLSPEGSLLGGIVPSKEYPLHLAFYQKDPGLRAVIHTHGPFSTLVSCLCPDNEDQMLPDFTPYLSIKVGKVCYIPYSPPGSPQLFDMVRRRVYKSNALLLSNHGPVVAGTSLMDAFYKLEELEESARLYWYLRTEPQARPIPETP